MTDVLKDLRSTGDLFLYYNFLGGNLDDQSGQQQPDLTLASGARAEVWGYRLDSGTPSGVALDMSSLDEFTVFLRLQAIQSTGADQVIVVFNRDHATRDGAWSIWLDSSLQCWCGYYNTTAAAVVSVSTSVLTRYNDVGIQFVISKKLTNEAIKPYVDGVLDLQNQTLQENTDATTFANEHLLIGASLTGTNRFTGIIESFGIHTRGLYE